MAKIHIIGAGLAGLAAAVKLCRHRLYHKGDFEIILYEATGHAGGRCRSFFDQTLGATIDNGTHLVLGVNQACLQFADMIGGTKAMRAWPKTYPFHHIKTHQDWLITPQTFLTHPLQTLRALRHITPATSVTTRLGASSLYERMWEPLCVGALNTAGEQADANLFASLLRLTLKSGLKGLTPYTFPDGLSAALIDPAIEYLNRHQIKIHMTHRLTALEPHRLIFADHSLSLSEDDRVILALPHWQLTRFDLGLPALPTSAIINAHFRLAQNPDWPYPNPFIGLCGGVSQWLTYRDNIVSVTVSNADSLLEAPQLEQTIWQEIAPLLKLSPQDIPPVRLVKEKRATLLHDPATQALRPSAFLPQYPYMILAGDWLQSPWPCTIEAAISSGFNAATLIQET